MRTRFHHHRRRRHHGDFPEGPFGGGFDAHSRPAPGDPGFPPVPPTPPLAGMPPGGPGWGRRHGRGPHGPHGRARRGAVRAAVLTLLAERPMHGYEMIQQIAERSGGFWRPSPGSVYPTLQLLADEGLITASEEGGTGKRLYSLTDAYRKAAGTRAGTPPWQQVADDIDPNEAHLRQAFGLLSTAVAQISQAADPAQKARAVAALTEVRQRLYLILAEVGGPVPAPGNTDTGASPETDTEADTGTDAAADADTPPESHG